MSKTFASAALAAATAMSAALVVPAAIPAAAAPPFCEWVLPTNLTLEQDNNIEVALPTDLNHSRGYAQYYKRGDMNGITNGTTDGSTMLHGDQVHIAVQWTDGPGAGLSNEYFGTIDKLNKISGYTVNNLGTRNNWTANEHADCVNP